MKKQKTKLKQFVVVTWNEDEGGGLSPISLPVHANSTKEIETAIKAGKSSLNKFKLPNADMFFNEYASKKYQGKVYTAEKWLNTKFEYLSFNEDEEDSVEDSQQKNQEVFDQAPIEVAKLNKMKSVFSKLIPALRLEVLDKINMFPQGAPKSMNPFIEIITLSMAKRQGKLKELWDEVMKRLPAEVREENPF